MMDNLTEVMDAYGYKRIPFDSVYMDTADSLKIGRLIKMAINSKRTIAVVGKRGIGKSWAIDAALRGQDYHNVHIENDNKEAIKVEHIQHAFFATLGMGSESVRRNGELRARQLTRIIGEAARRMPVVLKVEEAHRLHGQTILGIKTMLEKEYAMVKTLFVPILIAEFDPLSRPQVSSLRLRSDVVTMHGLSADEAKRYIIATVGKHFEPEAIDAAADLSVAKNFLELQGTIGSLMEQALHMGRKMVSVTDVYDLYHGGIKELIEMTGTQYSELQEKFNMSKAAISAIANGKTDKLADATFTAGKAAIGDYLREKLGGKKSDRPTLKAVGEAGA